MRPAPLARCNPVVAAFLLIVGAGCSPSLSPVSVRVKEEIHGPGDLVKGAKSDARWRAYQLRSFQMNHVWAGSGHAVEGGDVVYRAKITLWDFAEDGAALAEVYFHEPPQTVENPKPPDAKRPYQLHFSTTAMGPMLQALRNANEPVYLYYYDDQWALGINAPEPVGVD